MYFTPMSVWSVQSKDSDWGLQVILKSHRQLSETWFVSPPQKIWDLIQVIYILAKYNFLTYTSKCELLPASSTSNRLINLRSNYQTLLCWSNRSQDSVTALLILPAYIFHQHLLVQCLATILSFCDQAAFSIILEIELAGFIVSLSAMSHVSLLWLVVGLSKCSQKHFNLSSLITPLGNKNELKKVPNLPHIWLTRLV